MNELRTSSIVAGFCRLPRPTDRVVTGATHGRLRRIGNAILDTSRSRAQMKPSSERPSSKAKCEPSSWVILPRHARLSPCSSQM